MPAARSADRDQLIPAPARAPAATQTRPATPASPARAPTSEAARPSAAPLFQNQAPAIRLGPNTAGPASGGGGEPLPTGIRGALESSLRADFGTVRVHQDAAAQQAVRGQGARAFTFGSHIYLGPGEQTTDLRLMAHEAAHTVQQQAMPVFQAWSAGESTDRFEREAQQASAAATQHQTFTVSERTGGPQVQRLGLSDILDGLAELAANLPGFTLLTVIIGRNPISLRPVERNFTNLLRGFMGLIPGGEILFQVLSRYGVVARIGSWVSEQVAGLGLTYEYLRGRFTAFTDSLSWRDIFSPGDVWQRAQNIFSEPVNRIRGFITQLISQAITWLKETFMPPLSDFCRQIPGYTLVTVLLGRDPFTNTPVPRTALNLVRAFAEFIPGGTEKVNQLVESRALQRAYEWFTQETQARNLTWARVTGTFAQAWASLRLEDVLHPIDTLQRIIGMFRPLMSDLVGFAGAALMKLLEFIFEAAMGAGGARILAILKRARDTFQIIIQNPVGFLRNLLSAVGQGVRQFMSNILRHLQEGVIAWLTGPVARAGIQMPERWDLRGIIWFVLQILGLTWDRIRQKLVRLLGERAVALLESGFQLLQDIRARGLVQALRDRVTEFFGQLREAALGSIRSFIQQRLVMAGITQLLSLLNPVGAVIQAIIKTYTTIQFLIQRINQILDLVESVVNSIAAIAAGAIGGAANFIERTMARTIPIILDFLARFIGLGDVGGQVQRTIQALQARVDQMLDRAVDWIRSMAQRVGSAAVQGARSLGQRVMNWLGLRRPFRTVDGQSHTLYFEQRGGQVQLMRASDLAVDLTTYLNTLSYDASDPRSGKLTLAKTKAGQIILLTRTPDQAVTTPTQEADVVQIITDLSTLLMELVNVSLAQLPPAADWTQRAKTNNSHYSRVYLLSSLSASGGSAAAGTSPEFDFVVGAGWVRMHLIPYSVGGRGGPDNWVPAPLNVNSGGPVRSFETALETAVRSAAIPATGGMRGRPGRATQPNVVWVETQVSGYRATIADKQGRNLDFPRGVSLNFGVYRPDGTNWVKLTAPVSSQSVTIPPVPDNKIRLLSASGTAMRASGLPHLSGQLYSNRLVDIIKDVRGAGFGTYQILGNRLRAATVNSTLLTPAIIAQVVVDFQNHPDILLR